ncbi:hypothetical protein PR048_017385 [Dryococelus australis]|uniref:Uncharacterized protein n=1 Tax=Dryococelus australis TaxID=614101 RepID=A0ABQ9H9F3_9NEOP|nr:hypothetical protein PR048_017385 [Dryococelus australis]
MKPEISSSNKYHIQKVGNPVHVCKQFILNMFVVSNSSRSLGEALRGKQSCVRKISNEQRQAIIDHINNFPVFQSHYT